MSDAIFLLGKELNRGAWLIDRTGADTGGIGCEMISEVDVQATVVISEGTFIVESMSISDQGAVSQTSTEGGTQRQRGQVDNLQSGANTNTTTNDYKEE